MATESHFTGDRPSKYSLLNSSEHASSSKLAPTQTWQTEKPRTGYIGSFISAEDLHRQPHSYMVVPFAPSETKPLPKNTKVIVRWLRVVLLLLRICSWLGTAGILVCIVCIRPAGDAMDWFMRVPPPLALLHLSYTIYYLSRSVKDPTSAATNMTMAAILDACFIPCLGLYVILSYGQLSGTLDAGTPTWMAAFPDKIPTHITVYSLYLLSLSTAGLSVACFCICAYLTLQFRRIARLPPDMNPLQRSNLTARRHRKAATSASTIGTFETLKPEISIMVEDAAFSRSPALSGLVDRIDPRELPLQTTQSPRLSRTQMQGTEQQSPRNDAKRSFAAAELDRSTLSEEQRNKGQYTRRDPIPSYSTPPAELQHLRASPHRESGLGSIPILPRPKYDFSNRSPRPLGLHPPTPRNETPEKRTGFDVRTLRNIDGNSSAKSASGAVWDDVRLDVENAPVNQPGNTKRYGDVIGLGRVARNQARVVSSGIEEDARYGMRARMREVSGKVAEEGRGGLHYHDF